MADEVINPAVKTSIADMSGERVDQNAEETMPRHFWSALKNGHYRFALAGVAISVPITLAVGAVFCMAAGITGVLAPLVVSGFVAAGALMAVESFGEMGAASASRASGLAEKHARVLDADGKGMNAVGAADDKLMVTGRGHHFEQPIGRDKGKLYNVKSGLIGASIGAISGAVLGMGSFLAAEAAPASILGTMATGIAAALPIAAPVIAVALAGAAACALFGLTFGIDRNVLKTAFNETDSLTQGKLKFTNGPDLGRAQSLESDAGLAAHRMRRQSEMEALEKSYNDRIFWGAVKGHFRGFAAAAPGAAVGAVLGAIAFAATGLAAIPIAATIIPLFAAAGGMLAMKTMGESATQAGAEATARAIDNEFDRNRALRAQGITPPAPKETKDSWFSGKAGAICLAVGLAVGIALAPVVGVATLAIAGIHAAAFSVPAVATSMLISGLVGGTYGIGYKSMKTLAKPALDLYDSAGHAKEAAHEAAVAPAIVREQAFARPVCETITAEDMARLNEKQAVSNKTFVKTITDQQLQPAVAGMQA